jgi:hypothetical protein
MLFDALTEKEALNLTKQINNYLNKEKPIHTKDKQLSSFDGYKEWLKQLNLPNNSHQLLFVAKASFSLSVFWEDLYIEKIIENEET